MSAPTPKIIKAAIRSGDPYAISDAFTLPPLKYISSSATHPKHPSSSQSKYNERFSENGLDWSNAINSFLEAREYAVKVRLLYMKKISSLLKFHLISSIFGHDSYCFDR
jgi:hypothetical protein